MIRVKGKLQDKGNIKLAAQCAGCELWTVFPVPLIKPLKVIIRVLKSKTDKESEEIEVSGLYLCSDCARDYLPASNPDEE